MAPQMKQHGFRIFTGFLFTVLALRLYFVFSIDINWDEFYFLSNVHDYINGRLERSLQTAHVHLFTWLTSISKNEVHQIIAARLVMYALSILTLYFIYQLCKHFTSKTAAILAVIVYTCFTPVMEHAASFRTDPIATSMLMAALYITVTKQWHYMWFATSGVLIGLSGLITIKSILITPLFAIIMLIGVFQFHNKRRAILASIIAFLSALLTFAIFYLLHKSQLPQQEISSGVGIASHGLSKTILSGGLFPQPNTLIGIAFSNAVIAVALLFGIFTAIHALITKHEDRLKWLTVIAFCYPLMILVFYRNSFPYFYPLILAPASVLLAIAVQSIIIPYYKRPISKEFLAALAMIFVGQQSIDLYQNFKRTSDTQLATLETIHEMFPQPVAYIDRNSMVSSFPKKGFFMSSWGFENYHATGAPVMESLLQTNQPKFIIANIETLNLDDKEQLNQLHPHRKLLNEDFEVLRSNYIHHWGKIYVAGKQFSLNSDEIETSFEVMISGDYTLESQYPALINGKTLNPGHTLFLNQGTHILKGTMPDTNITLRFGKNLYMPSHSAPEAPIYFGF